MCNLYSVTKGQQAIRELYRAMVETLRLQLAQLRRMQFGRSSEKLDAEIAQLTLALEDLEARIERRDEPTDEEPTARPDASGQRPHGGRCRIICRARLSRATLAAPAPGAAACCGLSGRT